MRPMLAVRGTHPPRGDEWCHEVKWDGVRALVAISGEGTRVTTRTENDISGAFPELRSLHVRGPSGAVRECLLDGELVVLENGLPSFSAVASRLHRRSGGEGKAETPALLVVFDVLHLNGQDLAARPLRERRRVLDDLAFAGAPVQVSPLHTDGELLLDATRRQGLEGIVSKRLSSPYQAGRRSPDWVKFPHRRRTSWVVGGWTVQEGTSARLAALLVGEPSAEGLTYRGKVGTGFSVRTTRMLLEQLLELEREESPFVATDLPADHAVRWTSPELVVDVESLGLTASGKLRQPSFIGVRSDVAPQEVPGA